MFHFDRFSNVIDSTYHTAYQFNESSRAHSALLTISAFNKCSFRSLFKSFVCVVLLLAFHPVMANADNVRFTPFETDDLNSIAAISTIYQDSSGYIWFGTQEGINRYNGYEIEYFINEDDDDNRIASSRVNDIVEDDDGNIWIATYDGLSVYKTTNHSFTTYTHESHSDVIGSAIVNKLSKTIDGEIWFATDKGLSKYSNTSQKFTSYRKQLEQLGNPQIRSLATDFTGGVWIGTIEHGLLYFDPLHDSIRQIPIELNEAEQNNSIYFLKFGSDQTLYIGTSNEKLEGQTRKLFTLDITQSIGKSEKLTTNQLYQFKTAAIRDLIIAKNGVIWIATNSGLYYQEPNTDHFGRLTHDPQDSFSLIDDNIFDIYLDVSNVLWVATLRGLNRWNVNTSRFDHYKVKGEAAYELSNANITSISQLNDDILFIANIDGLDVINQKNGLVSTLKAIENEPNSLASNRVMTVFAENEENIWFGYFANGVSRYNLKTGKFKHYTHDENDPSSIGRNSVTSIVKDREGRLWFGTFNGGLSLYLPDTDSFKTYRHDPNDPNSISSNRIVSLYEDSSGLLWLGTMNHGVNVFNATTGVSTRIQNNPNDSSSLSANGVLTVHEDSNRNIWIGTHGGGLNLLKSTNRDIGQIMFTRFKRANGLLSDVVYGILSDKENNIWFSSNKGITKIDSKSYEMTYFNYSHGLQGNEFNSGAYAVGEDGKFYFGGSNGVTAFYPDDIQANPNKPNVIITAFNRLNQKENLTVEGGVHKAVEIAYTDYFFSFEFVALDFAAPHLNKYAYKLEGFDTEWISARNRKQATYTNLPSGTYTFRVRASNSDGIWNDEGVSIDVVVLPPPWQTWWAYLIYSTIFTVICFFIYRQRDKRARRKALYLKELEESVRARTSELSEANKKLRVVSMTDQLTGLHNRLFLSENIQSKCEGVINQCNTMLNNGELDPFNQEGPRLCCIMFDLDGFKPVNDNFGHSAGDKVIIGVAQLLDEICQSDDIVVRWGGDEFIIVTYIDKLSEAERLVENIRKAVASHSFNAGVGHPVKVSSSIGFALYPFSYNNLTAVSWDQVNSLADKALYHSKESGRNTWTGVINRPEKQMYNDEDFFANDIVEHEKNGHLSILRRASTRNIRRTYEA